MAENPYNQIADLYDIYVQTDLDIPFFLNEVSGVSGDILELMVGTGRVTLPLAEAGAFVTAVDNATKLLDILRQKLIERSLRATVIDADIRHLELDQQFERILIPFHAFPEITNYDDQLETLKRIRAHLAENGRFICTLHNPVIRKQSIDGQLRLVSRQTTDDGELLLWLLQQYLADSQQVTVLEFFEEYDSKGVMQRKRMIELQFNLLERAVFEELLTEAGFSIVELYGDYQRNPFDPQKSPFMIYVLALAVN